MSFYLLMYDALIKQPKILGSYIDGFDFSRSNQRSFLPRLVNFSIIAGALCFPIEKLVKLVQNAKFGK